MIGGEAARRRAAKSAKGQLGVMSRVMEGMAERGKVPPRASYIEVDNDVANDGSRLALDANGNAKGGVRNAYVDVPVAQYGVPNAGATPAAGFLCSIAGWRLPYDEEKLQTLYRNRLDYLGDVTRRAVELVLQGWLLPESVPDVLIDALEAEIPRRPR